MINTREHQRNLGNAGTNAISEIGDGRNNGISGDRKIPAGVHHDLVNSINKEHEAYLVNNSRNTASGDLTEASELKLRSFKLVNAFPAKEINETDPNSDIVTDSGSKTHTEHILLENINIQKIKRYIGNSHAKHGHNKS